MDVNKRCQANLAMYEIWYLKAGILWQLKLFNIDSIDTSLK